MFTQGPLDINLTKQFVISSNRNGNGTAMARDDDINTTLKKYSNIKKIQKKLRTGQQLPEKDKA